MKISELYKLYLASEGVEIDSRLIESNKLFFALKGEHVDGHQYVKDLIRKKDVYAIIDNQDFYINKKTILVNNVLECLQELSTYHRKQFDIPVIGITGSNGKTTTKELLDTVLDQKYNVHATKGNYNNHLGVPLTLLATPLNVEVIIVEMGANKKGDIEELCHIALPNYGLITNIGYAHIEGFGSYEGVIQTKTELYRFIKESGGILFCNNEDEVLMANMPAGIDMVGYPDPELVINDFGLGLKIKYKNFDEYHSLLYGIYNAINIQAAFAVGKKFCVSEKEILSAIEDYTPEMNRSQIKKFGSITFILDAYNANPSSMNLSIQSLEQMSTELNKVLILGDMKELGENELQYHQEILDVVSNYKWHKVITVGEIFLELKNEDIEQFQNVDALIKNVKEAKRTFENSIVLLKASRSIQLERLIKECF